MCKRFFRKGNVTFVVKVFSNATLQKHMKECDSPLMFTEMNIKNLDTLKFRFVVVFTLFHNKVI